MNLMMNIRRMLPNRGAICLARFYSDEGVRLEKTINNVQLLGRTGADPQKRGNEIHPLVTFSLATHVNYRNDAGELIQKTDWHRICVFKPSLREKVYSYLRKGQRVYVTGKIMYGEIQDDSGVRTTTSILADDVIFFQQV